MADEDGAKYDEVGLTAAVIRRSTGEKRADEAPSKGISCTDGSTGGLTASRS
jgi:hypothetical protein